MLRVRIPHWTALHFRIKLLPNHSKQRLNQTKNHTHNQRKCLLWVNYVHLPKIYFFNVCKVTISMVFELKSSKLNASGDHKTRLIQLRGQDQCDQIGRFIGLWATF